jgi:hypothetical protein
MKEPILKARIWIVAVVAVAALASAARMVHIGTGRLAGDAPLANRVRSGRKQP